MNLRDHLRPVRSVDCADGFVPEEVWRSDEPVKLPGLVRRWPAVRRCNASINAAANYLARFAIDAPVTAYAGDASIRRRFFYDDDFKGFNFARGKATIAQILAKLQERDREDRLTTLYVGSTPVDTWLPGFRDENDVRLPTANALASFWLGNQARISAHFDFPDNLACVVAGRRRFTLFPPEQIANLYVGPLDPTPSGQAISLVDFANPDLERHPRFAEAVEHGQLAEMQPGDAIFIPGMWWHHVESLDDFNLLINYWWCATPNIWARRPMPCCTPSWRCANYHLGNAKRGAAFSTTTCSMPTTRSTRTSRRRAEAHWAGWTRRRPGGCARRSPTG